MFSPRWLLHSVALFLGLFFALAAAEAHDAALSAENYANTPRKIFGRLDFVFQWLKPKSEIHVQGFVETGSAGDRSIEPDILVWRPLDSKTSHLWLGRAHPLREGLKQPNEEVLRFDSALGANWSQNQSNPLTPTTVGWVGAGLTQKIGGGWYFSVAASPLYLPNFGPRMDLKEDSRSDGSRFAKLPPQYVRLNGNLVPLRFKIDTGDIKDIVLQPQALFSIGYNGEGQLTRFYTWTAPTLNPKIDTSEALRIHPNDIDILVTAKPKFPRENFFGFSTSHAIDYFNPSFESVYENQSKRLTISQAFAPLEQVHLGGLHTWRESKPSSDGTESADYDNRLAWISLQQKVERFLPSLRVERHFDTRKSDFYAQAMLQYFATDNLEMFGKVRVLAGKDRSYFGAWRQLDSIHIGARYIW
jgi:hypothetical protein